jgi:flagellar basal body-associated protein FliL
MKHDYMTDRNWKLDDEPMESGSTKKSFKGFILGFMFLAILLIAGAVTWHYLKNAHASESQNSTAGSLPQSSQTTATNSPSQTSS